MKCFICQDLNVSKSVRWVGEDLYYHGYTLTGALFGLTHFLATESFFKTIKHDFYFVLKALFVIEIFYCKETA